MALHPLFEGLEPLLATLAPYETRAVGGAVRAVLRHDPMAGVDVDLATTATPQQVQAACFQARIPTAAEGARWGTVVASVGGISYEITTLRNDIYVAGSRYPTVTFVTNWDVDAQRRDFTMNAIYLSPDGVFFDPFHGVEDLRLGIVRFIGDPMQRLREDPLRLLRFWRFCALYGLGGATAELLEVFRQAAPGLKTLSRARVTEEWGKIQKNPQFQTVLAEMERAGLLPFVRERLEN